MIEQRSLAAAATSRASVRAAECCRSGAHHVRRSNSLGRVFVEHSYSQSCRRAYRVDCDAPDPTSSHRSAGTEYGRGKQEETAGAAQSARSSWSLRLWSGAPAFLALRLLVLSRGFD